MTAPLPEVFLPYQQRFMAAVDGHRVVVVEKSRRTGFSWVAGAIATLKAAATRAARGSSVYYMGYDHEMARDFIKYVGEWATALQAAASEAEECLLPDPDDPEKAIKAFRVEFASGFEVVALPSVPRALRGKQGLVIIDEAAFHDDIDGVLKSALALLMWGGRVVIVSTHNGEANPFNELVNQVRAGSKPYCLLRTDFNEAVEEGLCKRIFLKLGEEWSPEAEAAWKLRVIAEYGSDADEELFCIPNPLTGAFLTGALIEARTRPDIPVLRFECPSGFELLAQHLREAEIDAWIAQELAPVLATLDPDRPHVFGFDIARRGDLTVIWPLKLALDLTKLTPFIVELRNVPFAQQRQILWYILERLPRRRAGAMDATGLGMEIAEATMQKFGASIVMVMLTEPWYREHMPRFKAAFEDATATLPKDQDVIDDHRMLKLVRGVARVPERRLNDAGQKRHGDAAIAHCLAHFAAAAEPEFYDYQAARRGEERDAEQVTSTGWSDRSRAWEEDNRPAGAGAIPALRGAWH